MLMVGMLYGLPEHLLSIISAIVVPFEAFVKLKLLCNIFIIKARHRAPIYCRLWYLYLKFKWTLFWIHFWIHLKWTPWIHLKFRARIFWIHLKERFGYIQRSDEQINVR